MDKKIFDRLDIEAINAELTDDITRDLKTPVRDRRGFKFNSYTITIPRYFYRFIGIKSTEEEYYDNLYKLDRDMKSFTKIYLRFDKGLDRNISISMQNKLNDIWSKLNLTDDIDCSNIISQLENNGLFPSLNNAAFTLQIKNYFKVMLEYYVRTSPDMTANEFKLLVNYGVYWLNIYMKELFENFSYDYINPKVLYYGDITSEEAFFLVFLSTLGCDVLYYNPEQSGAIASVDKFNVFSREIAYIHKSKAKDFPSELRDRVKTTAYSAREELNKTLFDEGGSFYRPWQFVDYDIKAVTMRTTYEEINLWAKEKALIRDGWKVERGTVYIPNIFAKVSGTHQDTEKYLKDINEILNQKKAVFVNKLPIIEVVPLEYGKLEQVYPQRGGDGFDVEKLMKAPWWKYKELRKGLQRAIAEKIKELCINPVVHNVDNQEFRDFQVDIFSVLINLSPAMFNLLQDFDYPEEVPKIVVYNNEKNGNLSYEDCIILSFMNAMGVDIIIYNPSGYNDIEEFIYPDIYDVHHLEKMSFNLDFKRFATVEKKGFFKNIFGFK